MSNKTEHVELVAPAGDWNCLKAIKGIANAVYFGLEKYNMRANAINFKSQELKNIASFCHDTEPRLKVYLCTNILIYDSELKELEELICSAKEAGIDSIIAHDLGAIKIAKKCNIPFQISTQANVSNVESAKFFEEQGAERIILARELSLKQISQITQKLKRTKIECFIHGAMCTTISGRCYLSAELCKSEEFSGNRGKCAQPCRRKWRVIDDENNELIYDGQRFLNSKDLCMIEHVPELIKSNIAAFKIEGRMKDAIYVQTVTKCYRDAIENYYNGTLTIEKVQNWLKTLSSVFNRGFHTGFYFKTPTLEDIQLERGNISDYKKQYLGRVISFHESSKTANILIESSDLPLSIGDSILIVGKDKYDLNHVKKMYCKGDKISTIKKKSTEKPLLINLGVETSVEEDNKIYLIGKTQA